MVLAPSASKFWDFWDVPRFGGTGLKKHCEYQRLPKNPKLRAPKPCKYSKNLKILKFSALLGSLHARPDSIPEAYTLKNFVFP